MAAADLQGFLDEVDLFVLISEAAFLGMKAAVVFGKEIPSEHEVVDEVFNDATVHSHESPVNAKAYVDDAKRVDLAAIDADGPPFVRLDLIFEQVGVATQQAFADAGTLAACVTQSGADFAIDIGVDLGFVEWVGVWEVGCV